MFTPAIRATRRASPLPLLVARVRADHQDDAAPPDHPATLTHRLYGRSYLHPLLAGRIQSVTEKACRPHESGPRAPKRRPHGRPRMVAGHPSPAAPHRDPIRAGLAAPRLSAGRSVGSETAREGRSEEHTSELQSHVNLV